MTEVGTTKLRVAIGDLELAAPVMTAAGCGGTGAELARFIDVASVGAFVTRTLAVDPKADASAPRAIETASGLLVEEAMHNRGLQGFLVNELPALAAARCVTVVSIAGRSLGEHAELARRAGGAPGVAALELQLTDADPYGAGKAVGVVRRDTPRGVAVLVKLPREASHDLVRAVVDNGADGLVVAQAPTGLAIDSASLRPRLRGGLGGPAVLSLTTELVWRTYTLEQSVPVVGVGGVRTGADALTLIAAGATAVQVGTATIVDPQAPVRILRELTELLVAAQLDIADAVGIAHRGGLP